MESVTTKGWGLQNLLLKMIRSSVAFNILLWLIRMNRARTKIKPGPRNMRNEGKITSLILSSAWPTARRKCSSFLCALEYLKAALYSGTNYNCVYYYVLLWHLATHCTWSKIHQHLLCLVYSTIWHYFSLMPFGLYSCLHLIQVFDGFRIECSSFTCSLHVDEYLSFLENRSIVSIKHTSWSKSQDSRVLLQVLVLMQKNWMI